MQQKRWPKTERTGVFEYQDPTLHIVGKGMEDYDDDNDVSCHNVKPAISDVLKEFLRQQQANDL